MQKPQMQVVWKWLVMDAIETHSMSKSHTKTPHISEKSAFSLTNLLQSILVFFQRKKNFGSWF